MKKILPVILHTFLCTVACSQTEEEIAAAFVPDVDTQLVENKYEPLVDVMIKMDFKEDFLEHSTIRKNSQPSTSPLVFKHKKSVYLKDKAAFTNAYVSIKSDMLHYRDLDMAYHARDIQFLALRMLRYQFLPDSSEVALAETQFLLALLIEAGAVDLDVLADAYHKVQHLLSPQERTEHFKYLQKCYAKDRQYIADHFPRLKKGYETTTGAERKSYFYLGKRLEKISKTLRYSNDLLQLDTEQKN
jgi:hypothetical protein